MKWQEYRHVTWLPFPLLLGFNHISCSLLCSLIAGTAGGLKHSQLKIQHENITDYRLWIYTFWLIWTEKPKSVNVRGVFSLGIVYYLCDVEVQRFRVWLSPPSCKRKWKADFFLKNNDVKEETKKHKGNPQSRQLVSRPRLEPTDS
jgi:hypothetical protein